MENVFNLNSKVTVRLTGLGLRVLSSHPEQKSLNQADRTLTLKAWDIFRIFGKYISSGAVPPFDMNILVHEPETNPTTA